METAHLFAGEIAARRIVGIGEIDDSRPRADGLQHRIDIDAQVLLRDNDRHGAVGECRNAIEQERVRAEHHLVARTQVSVGQQRQDLARTIAADEAIGIEAVGFGDRLAQGRRTAVRIEMKR